MQTVENPRDFTEGGGGNPLILLSPEDQDPLASLLPWLQPLFSHFLLANRACLFLYLHEHFSYLLGNTCWVEENAGLTLSCFTNLTSTVPQRQLALWSIPVCALGPKMNKLHLTFCSFQTNFPPGHAWARELTLAGVFSARPSPQFKALLGCCPWHIKKLLWRSSRQKLAGEHQYSHFLPDVHQLHGQAVMGGS